MNRLAIFDKKMTTLENQIEILDMKLELLEYYENAARNEWTWYLSVGESSILKIKYRYDDHSYWELNDLVIMIGFHEVVEEVCVQHRLDDACYEGSHENVLPVEDPALGDNYQWKM